MGTITCLVSQTLTITSISEDSPGSTWARFKQPFFQVSGGGTFDLALTVPGANFRFEPPPAPAIDWGPSGQPTWITITQQQSDALTLQISSATPGASQFTVLNATQGGLSLTILVQSLGGSGGAADATIKAYVGDAQTVLIGPMPVGAIAGGSTVHFGFHDQGENELFLLPTPAVVLNAVDWPQGEPDFIELDETSLQTTFSIDNQSSSGPRLEADFMLDTNVGRIDPTIITNPDENGP